MDRAIRDGFGTLGMPALGLGSNIVTRGCSYTRGMINHISHIELRGAIVRERERDREKKKALEPRYIAEGLTCLRPPNLKGSKSPPPLLPEKLPVQISVPRVQLTELAQYDAMASDASNSVVECPLPSLMTAFPVHATRVTEWRCKFAVRSSAAEGRSQVCFR